jgi:hypothetical protein
MSKAFKKPRTKLLLKLLVAVVALGLVFLALRPREPAYHGKRLSAWIEDLSEPQRDMETLADVKLRWQELTNVVRAIGTEALPPAVAWIRDKPRESLYDEIQYRIENAFRARIHLPERKDRSCYAIWVFQILGPEAKPVIPDLAELALSEHTCYEAARCLSMIGPVAVPAVSNAVANGTGRVRLAAIDALGEIGHSAAPTASLLRQIIRTNDQSTWEALRTLAEVATDDASLLPMALKCLEDTSSPSRAAGDFGAAPGAAYALARIGPEGVPALLEAITNAQSVIRASGRAAFDPAFQEMLSGRKPSDFYTRSGHFQSVFIREMTLEATAKTVGHYPDDYYQKLLTIAGQYASSTNPALRSAASRVTDYVDTAKMNQ